MRRVTRLTCGFTDDDNNAGEKLREKTRRLKQPRRTRVFFNVFASLLPPLFLYSSFAE